MNPGPVLIYGAIFSKSFIQFTLDGCGCIWTFLFELRPNCGVSYEHNWDLFKRTWVSTLVFSAHHPAASHSWTMLLPETPAHSRARLAQFLVGTLLLLLAPGEHKALFVPSNSLLQSCGSSIIKSNWLPMSNVLWVLSPVSSLSLCQIPRLKNL